MSNATRRGTLATLAGFLTVPALPVEAGSADYPHAAAFAEMLAAYEEDRRSRPVGGAARINSMEARASMLVQARCYRLAEAFAALPAIGSLDDLGAKAVATAIACEAMDVTDMGQQETVHLIRAVLAFTGRSLPAGHVGFGDDPEMPTRDAALHAGEGSLAAWAVEEAMRQA